MSMLTDITRQKDVEAKLKETLVNLEKLVKQRTAELEEAYNSLKKSEKSLAEAQKMAHVGNWEWDARTNETYWSEELYRIFGRDPKEGGAPYLDFLNYVHPDDKGYVDNAAMKALSGKPYSIDFRIVLASEEERSVHMQSEIVLDEKNNLIRMKGILQDITERKKTEEQLQYAYCRLRTFFDRKIEGIGIVIGNAQGDILEANDYYLHMLGFTRKDLEADAVRWSDITPPEWLPADEKALTELLKQGVYTPYEKEYIRKDGSRIPVLIANTIFPGGKGEILAFVLDITESKRMEEALRQNEALLYAFLEQSPVGLGLADSQGNWLVTNSILRRFVTGVIPELDLENNWRWQARGMDRRLLKQAEWPSARALRSESVIPVIDFIYSSKEGREIWTRVSSVPFRNEVGDIEGIITVIQDIDEQKRTEDALVKMEKIRIKEIHHRIKNNLQVISSLLDLQAETFSQLEVCKTPDVVEAFLESQNRVISMALIHEELYKGDKIDTLDFSAYLKKLAEDVFGSYTLGNKDISLKLELDEIFVGMDTAIPLGIIVNELVSNAFKYAFPAGRKGEIQISLCKNENFTSRNLISNLAEACKEENRFYYILKVSDNGKGISKEIDFQNTGTLGLQLVNILVEQIDGCIELKKGKGTEFIIRFNNAEV